MLNPYSEKEKLASKQLSFYASKRYLPEDVAHVAFLYPFWGKSSEDRTNPTSSRYDKYIELGSALFKLKDLEQAQIGVLPFDWTHAIAGNFQAKAFAQDMAQVTAHAGIPLAVFYLDDAVKKVELDNSVVFRTSANRSSLQSNEHVIPAWSEDFVEHYCQGSIQIRTKARKPTIGYCGYSAIVEPRSRLTNQIRLWLGSIPKAAKLLSKFGINLVKHPLTWLYGARLRSQALFILKRSEEVQCNFLIQDKLHHTEKLTLQQRQKFVENMLDSDYILCTRGGGNFSYRFYETLSCGRIPVLINTDCKLPFERWIDWKKYCVWVEEEDLPHLGKRIGEFHDRLTPGQFQDLQLECRQLWVEWLSPQGFLANFHRYFEH